MAQLPDTVRSAAGCDELPISVLAQLSPILSIAVTRNCALIKFIFNKGELGPTK
jgi:hypothetical protein